MLNTEKAGWEDNGQLELSHRCLLSEPWDGSGLHRDWCAGRQGSVFRKQMLYFILLLSLGDSIIRRRSGAVVWIWLVEGFPRRAWRRSPGAVGVWFFSYNIRLKIAINNTEKENSDRDFYRSCTWMILVRGCQREILSWSTVTLSLLHFRWGVFFLSFSNAPLGQSVNLKYL